MSNFKKFKEYLNNKGNMEKVIVDPSGDTGPSPTVKPEPAVTKGKGWNAEAPSAGKPEPYEAKNGGKAPEKGFAYAGDKDLEVKFGKETEKKLDTGDLRSKTEQFIADTEKLSVSEFTSYLKEAYNTQDLAKVISLLKETAECVKNSDTAMDRFISLLEDNGSLPLFVEVVFGQPAAMKALANLISESPMTCLKLVSSLNEITDAPASDTEPTKKDVSDEPKSKRKTASIGGEKLDMAGSDVVTTSASMMKKKMCPEHHLVKALASFRSMNETMKQAIK